MTLFLLPHAGFAAETKPISLDEALAYAREHYPQIKAAEAELSVQDAAVQTAQAALLPKIGLNTAFSDGFSNSAQGLALTGGIANSASSGQGSRCSPASTRNGFSARFHLVGHLALDGFAISRCI